MRPTGSLLQVAVCLSSLTPLTAAWPGWSDFFPAMDTLVVRADSSSSNAENTANLNTAVVETDTATGDATGDATDTATATDSSDSEETGTSTGTATGKKSKTTATGKKSSKESKETHTTYGANDAAGGVSLKLPQTTVQATPLYKIGDDVTFAWNYTSLQGTPTAIDVLVSCSSASATWTLTQNMTFATKVTYVWDTDNQGGVETQPLLVELYTLVIKDSDSSVSDIADPGYLSPYTGLTFGLYTGQPYTPLSEWKCVGCNAGASIFDTQALGLAMSMCIITIGTFTWFVAGLGLH